MYRSADPAGGDRKRSSFTVAICAYNAVGRIHRALDALSQVHYAGNWEVLVVDNASTDGTAAFAGKWRALLPAMRVIGEPAAGVAHARVRAIHESRCDWIVWVDDDNILPPDYLETANSIVAGRNDVGVVAGDSNLMELAEPPPWFEEVAGCYAVGRQFPDEGEQGGGAFCWGAGSMLRRAAVLQVFGRDFRPILSGRLGRHQLAGEDAELCLATRLLGWGFLYSRDLVIGHAIEPERMSLSVLKKTAVGFGLSSIALEVYRAQFDPPFKRWVKTTDMLFIVYSFVKLGMRSLNSLLRKNMRARTALWMSQGAVVGLLSGMRPSRVLASPFLAKTISQRRHPVESAVR
jgi:glycosyltransferase involved in cell wall biosynthesis